MPKTGVLCMAYGSPDGLDGVEAYYTHIRHGKKPSREQLDDLLARYRAIGGSPLAEITRSQAEKLGEALGMPAFVGFKHSAPFISDGALEAQRAGVERLIGLPLAPHYSRMSLGSYEETLRSAWAGELVFIRGFHDHPGFIEALRRLLAEAMDDGWVPNRIFFTAHSLPERIIREGDPYRDQLLETCRLVVDRVELPPWEFAYQSKSTTGEPWLGPDLLEALDRSRVRRALVCPIGFVADHLEILYDLDVEAQEWARANGVELRRTPSFNDRPEFIEALVKVVRDRL